jgi:hypothetical protein
LQLKAYEYILEGIEAGDENSALVRVPALNVRKHLDIPPSNFKRSIVINIMLNDSLEIHGIY